LYQESLISLFGEQSSGAHWTISVSSRNSKAPCQQDTGAEVVF